MFETGFYRNFKDEDAFVFSGYRSQVEGFRKLMHELSISELNVSFSTDFLFGHAPWNVSVSFLSATDEVSFFRIIDEERRQACWEISKPAVNLIIDLIDGLINSENPGHIYFDGCNGSVLVIVSMDEGL
jgi:hypothetical protein